ncbi:unnamed protein product, partial [Allacma fusca]
FENYDI